MKCRVRVEEKEEGVKSVRSEKWQTLSISA